MSQRIEGGGGGGAFKKPNFYLSRPVEIHERMVSPATSQYSRRLVCYKCFEKLYHKIKLSKQMTMRNNPPVDACYIIKSRKVLFQFPAITIVTRIFIIFL